MNKKMEYLLSIITLILIPIKSSGNEIKVEKIWQSETHIKITFTEDITTKTICIEDTQENEEIIYIAYKSKMENADLEIPEDMEVNCHDD